MTGIDSRDDRIWTCDFLVPNQALYQTELHPEVMLHMTVGAKNFALCYFCQDFLCTPVMRDGETDSTFFSGRIHVMKY